MDDSTPSLVLLYDGVCGFCNRTVQTVIGSDRNGTLRFAALQGDFGQAVLARYPELKEVDSVMLVKTGTDGAERVLIRSTAALEVARYLGGFWSLLLAGYVVPTPIRDFFYDLFAKYRYALFGKFETCMLPPPEIRARFL
jgi:predicted DCC family thiol-disulfide oxidoreductase YuxK